MEDVEQVKEATSVAVTDSVKEKEEKVTETDLVEGKEETIIEDGENENNLKGTGKKPKGRKRKKTLHAAIRKQMEFYFSDANLSKDRFMQNAIKEGPEVPLDVFMSFNKVRSLTEDTKEIAKALKFSQLLKVSDDETKVFRATPFRPKSQEEVDLCTIYVEHLPPHTTIEWLTKMFSEFGAVAYVSLPKFKEATRIKGFAFIEFCDAESANKAVQTYTASNAYASLIDDPGQLCSIQAFNAESQGHYEVENQDKTASPNQDGKQEDVEEPMTKRRRVGDADNIPEDGSVKEEESDKELKASKKKRKRTCSFQEEINHEAQTLSLQVMSKKEWKKLRNKYLDIQRKCLRQVRMNARRHQQNYEEHVEPVVEQPEPPAETAAEFQPGLIIKIILDEPICDAKRFKSQVKSQEGVSYVEAQDCGTEVFIRCNDASAAKSLVEKKIWSQADILQGEEETDYWRKIDENRHKKRERSTRSKKSGAERARQKKEAPVDAEQAVQPSRPRENKNQHVRFDED